jgi:hypothetical protein
VTSMRLAVVSVVTAFLISGGARAAAAQSTISQTDIQRLENTIYDASRDVAQLRGRDATLANRLQSDLDDARDETTYLKVKLRKNETVTRSDYRELSDRVDAIRSQARGENPQPSQRDSRRDGEITDSPAPVSRTAAPGEVPAGTELDVRLSRDLNSGTAQVEDRFEATTMVDLMQGDRVLIPAGSVMRGVVSSVNKAGRVERKGSLTVAFDQVTIHGRNYPIRGTVTQALESEGIKGEAGKIGVGAGVGAILGGILGGFKGAMAGILIGGGGTIAATEGKDVDLPAGSVLRVRLDSNLNVR